MRATHSRRRHRRPPGRPFQAPEAPERPIPPRRTIRQHRTPAMATSAASALTLLAGRVARRATARGFDLLGCDNHHRVRQRPRHHLVVDPCSRAAAVSNLESARPRYSPCLVAGRMAAATTGETGARYRARAPASAEAPGYEFEARRWMASAEAHGGLLCHRSTIANEQVPASRPCRSGFGGTVRTQRSVRADLGVRTAGSSAPRWPAGRPDTNAKAIDRPAPPGSCPAKLICRDGHRGWRRNLSSAVPARPLKGMSAT